MNPNIVEIAITHISVECDFTLSLAGVGARNDGSEARNHMTVRAESADRAGGSGYSCGNA
jgi:hypothetical protein